MMSKSYPADIVATFGFHDSRLISIAWSDNDQDLTFFLTWLPPLRLDVVCPTGPTPSRLMAVYATDLIFDIEFGDLIGAPRIYDVTLDVLSNGRKKVTMNFLALPQGFIEFECNDI